jgi:predicted MFS family arabinose efflux permease
MSTTSSATHVQVLAMAMTAGVTIANIYYNQPILSQIAASLGISEAQAGNIPVLTQLGFSLGLFFLAPLGDMLDRKALIIALEGLLCAALLIMAQASHLSCVYLASFLVGGASMAVQIVIPMAAGLAHKDRKGHIVSIVFTGTLIGILTARIVSGYVAKWFGWRWVYGGSAGLAFAVILMVAQVLPKDPGHHTGSYAALLRSTLYQFVRFDRLRRISLLGALVFGTFCSFWTTLTFHLSAAPFHYRSDTIGLFGVAAVASALIAPIFGQLADKGRPECIQVITLGVLIAGVLSTQLWPTSVVAIIISTILLDMGVQATQVNNLAQIYALDESSYSRINTIFMTFFFLGGAVGTSCGLFAWSVGGWQLVCWQLLLWSTLGFSIALRNAKLASNETSC